PTGRNRRGRKRPQLAGTSRNLVYFQSIALLQRLRPIPTCTTRRPLGAAQTNRAQAPRGCANKPVRPAGADHPHFAQLRRYAMRTFDLAPLYRSTVGFDRLFSMLDGFEAAPGYPPYNIERTGENAYRISVAVAGFGENELSIEAKENTLTIKGEKQTKDE